MNSPLYRLVYLSQNRIEGSERALRHAIDNILAASRRNNGTAGITGALMFNSGRFAQVLEGPHDAVQETFERIQCDMRHTGVVILAFEKAVERRFSTWAMAYVGENTKASNAFDYVTRESGFNPAELDGERVFELLHEHLLEAERGRANRSTSP